MKSGEPVAVSERQLDVLRGWSRSRGRLSPRTTCLRRLEGRRGRRQQPRTGESRACAGCSAPCGGPYIETVPRRGYRFGVAVTRRAPRESDAGLDALLAPHRAFIEGRAALETLEADHIARARDVFEGAVAARPSTRRRTSGSPTPASCSSR